MMATLSSSVSVFQRSSCAADSSLLTVLDKVDITSDGLSFAIFRGVKIAAKASSDMALGKLEVTEMGR